jgi:hypothetical protein
MNGCVIARREEGGHSVPQRKGMESFPLRVFKPAWRESTGSFFFFLFRSSSHHLPTRLSHHSLAFTFSSLPHTPTANNNDTCHDHQFARPLLLPEPRWLRSKQSQSRFEAELPTSARHSSDRAFLASARPPLSPDAKPTWRFWVTHKSPSRA